MHDTPNLELFAVATCSVCGADMPADMLFIGGSGDPSVFLMHAKRAHGLDRIDVRLPNGQIITFQDNLARRIQDRFGDLPLKAL